MSVTYLDRILDAHRVAAANDPRSIGSLMASVDEMPATRAFRRALDDAEGIAVISEVKRRSPSKGDLLPGLNPVALAREYERGGASCLSVLTDEQWFGGSVADLQAAREATSLPVIRKDFTVDARDVVDTRLMGADCVLLIAAALDDHELSDFHALATEIGLDVLVEIHGEAELERALLVNATLIGVNQRDLVTFEVDQERAVRIAPLMPCGVVRVAESGVRDAGDSAALHGAGYHALLVGETLVTSGDPAAEIGKLRAVAQPDR
ncbi:MAG: indole-3-glycerol phosphate synthase TrpC [Acidimicrobiaceae bacterium]|nr:indole-3-glycerol phosphate synthase TrpC [Acidimicrobiaceae bacterium]MBT5580883.1 indole-3-glycerol phosphate synthase TrpC [Acidimicrobiaceae bacterium]